MFPTLYVFELKKGILKGHIEEKITSLSEARTHESRIYSRVEIQKYFVHFLVQMKTVEFAFEIN